MSAQTELKTFLWFNGNLEDALDFYAKTLDDVVIHNQNRQGPGGPLFTAEFSIAGHEMIALNWADGPVFNDSISLALSCDGQAETDRLWDALTAEGEAGQCGWLKEKFGLSWQVIPRQMGLHLGNPDPAKAAYAMAAMGKMTKIVIADLYE